MMMLGLVFLCMQVPGMDAGPVPSRSGLYFAFYCWYCGPTVCPYLEPEGVLLACRISST